MESSNILVGIREIAEYLLRGPKVVRRLIREGLPVSLVEGAYMTTKSALDEWLEGRCQG